MAETVQHLLRERLGSSGWAVKSGDQVWTWAQYLNEASGQAAAVIALADPDRPLKDITGQDVHLAGYSQGGMFCYQTAAYRGGKDIASIVVFGSPVDTLAGVP